MTTAHDFLLVRSLKRQPVPRTPVWMMRQAGRYLPAYREVRARAGDFLTLCKHPEWACEVTLQPFDYFRLDAAILFSDILTIPDAMGLGLAFHEGEGPMFHNPIQTKAAVEALPEVSIVDDLAYVMDTVRLIRKDLPLSLPLIGFAGSPWTLACYMVEGRSSRDFKTAIQFMYDEPMSMHHLLTKLAHTVLAYLDEQVQAGVNVLMLFDTWGGLLTPWTYRAFSLHYMDFIVRALKSKYPDIPIILFTKGGGEWITDMAETGCDAIGLDWTVDLQRARRLVGDKVALQGNLDPAVLRAHPDCIREQVLQVLSSFGQGSGHIFNLGHGVTPDIAPEHVRVMIDAVHAFSPAFHTE